MRSRLAVSLAVSTASQATSQLERIAASLEDTLRFVFPGSGMALTLAELHAEKERRLPASASPRAVATVEVLSESVGGLAGEGPANFVDQDAAAPVDYIFDFAASVAPRIEAAVAAAALLAAARRQVLEAASLVAQRPKGAARGVAASPFGISFRCFRPEPFRGQLLLALHGTEEPESRATLHKLLRLPEAPLLRPECALPWASEAHPFSTGKPINPHLDCGLQPGWWKGGTETKSAFTRGMYEYCHYMQDQFNDNGLGCAYRSLQTCVSWYRLQFYSSKPVPSISGIQELLKRVDEFSRDLEVGSRHWVGTYEAQLVLQDYLGIEVGMEYCIDVADMANKVPRMLQHLQTHGTPIMVGAGQRAFTIVGICYDEASGEVAFLVVDPHYTGADELKTILQKGWVGWKKLELFAKNANGGSINCCLPMVPQGPSNI